MNILQNLKLKITILIVLDIKLVIACNYLSQKIGYYLHVSPINMKLNTTSKKTNKKKDNFIMKTQKSYFLRFSALHPLL